MAATIHRDDKSLPSQRTNLVLHVLDDSEAAMENKHRGPVAIGFKINPKMVDVDILSAMRLAGDDLPDIKSEPPRR